MPDSPLVSVILATYHWPSVLEYAIKTVLWQTFTDFELLVIGDHCTDGTEALVHSFNDPRIHWHNLPENTGSQAGPCHYGLQKARGKYAAYIHQDDLWLPDHLQHLANALESPAAHDQVLAHTLAIEIGPPPRNFRRVLGLPNTGKFGPERVPIITPATMHHTEPARQVGGWPNWKEVYNTPDLVLWTRLVDRKPTILSVPKVTVLKFHSRERKNSYIEQRSDEQAAYFDRIQHDPDLVNSELIRAFYAQAHGLTVQVVTDPIPVNAKPGWKVDQYRRIRGLPATELQDHQSIKPYFYLIRHRIANVVRKLFEKKQLSG
jgi:glycosyltransferase involved in cell wall biosynthesis